MTFDNASADTRIMFALNAFMDDSLPIECILDEIFLDEITDSFDSSEVDKLTHKMRDYLTRNSTNNEADIKRRILLLEEFADDYRDR